MLAFIVYVILANITCYIVSEKNKTSTLSVVFEAVSFLVILVLIMSYGSGYLGRYLYVIGILNAIYVFFLLIRYFLKLYTKKYKNRR